MTQNKHNQKPKQTEEENEWPEPNGREKETEYDPI